jgi:hypothetical protein
MFVKEDLLWYAMAVAFALTLVGAIIHAWSPFVGRIVGFTGGVGMIKIYVLTTIYYRRKRSKDDS